jgi:hypothetical protein
VAADFVFVWSPVPDWPATYPATLVGRFSERGTLVEDWRIRSVRRIAPGDRAYIFAQARPHRCIFAVGTVDGPVKAAVSDRPHAMVPLRIERIAPPDNGGLLSKAELDVIRPDALKGIRASGVTLDTGLARAIDDALLAKFG